MRRASPMRVTVTGGTGFLGSFLVRDLLAKAVSVRALVRPSPRSGVLRLMGAELVPGDLADADSIARAVAGADVVYHLAAKVGSAPRDAYFETNLTGTENVLSACAKAGVKQLVYASSLAVYGPIEEGQRIDENTPFDDHPELRDPYAESKIKADQLVSTFARSTNLPTVIVREGIIYGPGRPLPIGMFAFRRGRKNIVFGKPEHRFPLNYVGNIVEALQAVAAAGSGFRHYNVLDDDDLTLGAYNQLKSVGDGSITRYYSAWPLYVASPFAEALRSLIPMGDTRLSRHQLRRSLQDRWYDTSLIRQETGWSPAVSLGEGIHRTLRSQQDG